MSIVDPDIAGGAGPPGDDGGALEGAAYCPHCSAPVGGGEFPWPPDPTRCPSCGQWIGRNRAAAQPFDAAPAAEEADEQDEGAPRGKPKLRAPGFLRGRRPDGEAEEEAPEAEADGDRPGAAEGMWAPDTFEFDAPPSTTAQAADEQVAEEEPATPEPPAAQAEIDDEPAAAEPQPSRSEAAGVRRRRGGLAGRMRELGSRVRSDLLPGEHASATGRQAPPVADEREPAPAEPTAVEEHEVEDAAEAEALAVEDDAREVEAEPAAVEDEAGEPEVDEPEVAAEAEAFPVDEHSPPAPDDEPEPAEVDDEWAAADDEPAELAEPPVAEEDEEPAEVEDEPEAEELEEPVADHDEAEQVAEEPAQPEGEPDMRTVVAHLAVARLATSADAKTSRLPIPQKLPSPRIARPKVPTIPRRPSPKPTVLAEGAKRKRQPMRITGVAMVVIGLLILAYGTVTLVWQDPWTAWQTARAQKRAKVQYDKIVKDFRKSAAAQTKVATRDWLHRQAALFNLHTPEGQPVGRLSIPKIGIHFTIVQGTEETTLQKGPAHYVETPLPGAKGKWTVGIAGHRTTYLAPFRHIDQLDPGDKVYISMPYARFYYTVEKTKIVPAAEETALAADNNITGRKPYNRLALTACHPPFSAAERIIVYAKLLHYKINRAPS